MNWEMRVVRGWSNDWLVQALTGGFNPKHSTCASLRLPGQVGDLNTVISLKSQTQVTRTVESFNVGVM